jgi:hypothetical protein
MSIRTAASAVMVLAVLLLVALAPTGAAAHTAVHAGHAHRHVSAEPVRTAGEATATRTDARGRIGAVSTEIRMSAPSVDEHQTGDDCGGRGCCANGHCSACGNAIAPALWVCLRLPANLLVLNPDVSPPAALAREGPARPPRSLA